MAAVDGSFEVHDVEDAFLAQHGGVAALIRAYDSADESWLAVRAAHMGEIEGLQREREVLENSLLQKIKATPATTRAGHAAKLEVALVYSDFDPSGTDSEDLPWSLILDTIRELEAGGSLAGTAA